MSPNAIAGYIAGWFGEIPRGLFLPLKTNADNQIVVDEAARDKTVERRAIAWLDTAIAIVLAESGGNPDAKNSSTSASGLWQIMVSVHQEKIEEAITWVGSEKGDPDLTIFDPAVNTVVASRVYGDANGWSPWEAYNTGAYKKHLGHGEAAWKFLNSPKYRNMQWQKFRENLIASTTYANVGAIAGRTIPTPVNVANSVMAFVKQSGVVAGVFLIGLILVLLGVFVFVRAGQNAVVKAVT